MKDEHRSKEVQKEEPRSFMAYIASFFMGALAILLLSTAFSFRGEELTVENVGSSLAGALMCGLLALIVVSPWKKANHFGGGLIVFGVGLAIFIAALIEENAADLWYSVAWAIPLLLWGTSLMLQAFDKTIGKVILAFFENETVRRILKVLFWGIVISTILLLVGGVVGFIAGLSATTIIIILLILILLK